MFLILSSELCNDYVLATILTIVRRSLTLIQIVVPIVLIIAGTIELIKLTLNPDDDKKGKKRLLNSFMSAVIIFFIPLLINLLVNIIYEYGEVGIYNDNGLSVLRISSCWNEVEQVQNSMDSVRENGGSNSKTIKSEESTKKSTLGSTNNYTNSSSGNSSAIDYYSQSNNTELGNSVISYAKQFLGNPYVWGGNSLTSGTDCSGFVHLIYEHFNVNVPRSSSSLRTVGKEIPNLSSARAGDIICYNGHVALFMGDGNKIIHASNPKSGIKISENASYRTILSIRRVID